MKTQKTIAVIIILASSVLTAGISGDITYPTILCMLGLLGLHGRFTWEIDPQRRVVKSLLLLLLTIMFALHYHYFGASDRPSHLPAEAAAWQTITRYFLASMILILFLRSPDRLPPSLGLFHLAITISAGQVLLLDDMYILFRALELLSVIMVVLYITAAHESILAVATERNSGLYGSGRRRHTSHWLVLSMILIVTANFGWIAGSILYRNVEILNYLPVWFWRVDSAQARETANVSHMGFSTSGKLSNVLLIKDNQDPTPVLTITSDRNPGYLRARAFEVYRQSEWHDLLNREAILPEQGRPFGMYVRGRTSTFYLKPSNGSITEYMTIRHGISFGDAVFTPLGVCSIEAPIRFLLCNDDDILYARNMPPGLDYRITYTKTTRQDRPTRSQGLRLLRVPEGLDPRIGQLADRIFEGCNTTSEKINAVVNHFGTKYTYSLSMNIPSGRDKLTSFLLDQSSGYCEYFASGAAILLRLAGVPTRYVTGFFVTDKDPESGSWIARNMNAHAWVEAWDQDRREWTVVEATVQEGLASTAATEDSAGQQGDAGIFFGRLLQALYEYGVVGVLSLLFSYYGPYTGLLISLTLAGGAVLLVVWRRRKSRSSRYGAHTGASRDAALVSMHRMLARMDRKVKAAGQLRDTAETLHTFSYRLRERDAGDGIWIRISDWYLEYANLRYNKRTERKRLQQVHELADSLQKTL